MNSPADTHPPDADRRPEPVPPGSVTETAMADWRLLLLLPQALLLQTCHPVIGAGVGQHSVFGTDPWGRFERSWWATVGLAFYGERAVDYGRDLRAMHKPIGGVDHRGRRYHAWDPEAYFFVLATGFHSAEIVADRFGRPLTRQQREELYAGVRRMARLAGLRERDLPADLPAFRRYFDRVLDDRLEDHPTTARLLAVLRRPPAPPRVPERLWRPIARRVVVPVTMLVTTGTLPPTVRDRLGLAWTPADERRLDQVATLVRMLDAVLPPTVRHLSRTVALRRQDAIIADMARQAARA